MKYGPATSEACCHQCDSFRSFGDMLADAATKAKDRREQDNELFATP